jgi:exodeoxyribonuclease VII small subunit
MAKKVINYSALNTELDQIISELEQPDLPLDTAIKHYRRGNQIVAELHEYLQASENEVSKIIVPPDASAA